MRRINSEDTYEEWVKKISAHCLIVKNNFLS